MAYPQTGRFLTRINIQYLCIKGGTAYWQGFRQSFGSYRPVFGCHRSVFGCLEVDWLQQSRQNAGGLLNARWIGIPLLLPLWYPFWWWWVVVDARVAKLIQQYPKNKYKSPLIFYPCSCKNTYDPCQNALAQHTKSLIEANEYGDGGNHDHEVSPTTS